MLKSKFSLILRFTSLWFSYKYSTVNSSHKSHFITNSWQLVGRMPSGEVPSSSPSYTPLQPPKHGNIHPITPERLNFASESPNPSDFPGQNHIDSASHECDDASSGPKSTPFYDFGSSKEHVMDMDASEQPSSGNALTPGSNPPDMTFDFNETVDTDSDFDENSTQHYLDGLLTESLMETLPMPPEKRQHLRELCGENRKVDL